MASKKDLVEAQGFSRRRLLTAFVSGAPGGRELEPTKPLRAVVGGVALTVLVVVGSMVSGMVSQPLAKGWNDNKLVITKDEKLGGSRYVAIGEVLYPVLNVTSARLLIPAGSFAVLTVGVDKIADAERGKTVGITGAPDALPGKDQLISTGWLNCTSPRGTTATVLSAGGTARQVAAAAQASAGQAAGPGLLVEAAGEQYLVMGGLRHLIPQADRDAVLRAVGQGTTRPWSVTGRWLNLFRPGSDLAPVEVKGAQSEVPGGVVAPQGAVIGSVLSVTATGERYVVDASGELAALSDFAEPLYRLGSGAQIGPDLEVTNAQLRGMGNSSEVAAPDDWPKSEPSAAPDGGAACAVLTTGADSPVGLAFSTRVKVPADGDERRVDPSGGALVRAGAHGPVQLIDQSGTAFPVPDASAEILGRLGFGSKYVTEVPEAWLRLFPAGPALTVDAAGKPPQVPAG